MRRIISLTMCLVLLCPLTVRASEVRYVALTFDDGPSGRFTRRLLEGLAERDAKATFLLCGYRIQQYPDLVEQMLLEGHEIGIHGYSHKDMAPMTRTQIAKEIMDTQALLPEDCKVTFFRAPGGCYSDGVRQVAKARGLAVLKWSVDPRDWEKTNAWAIDTAVVEQVKDGDVVLLHDMSDSSVDAALAIVDHLQFLGFQFVTVSELVRLRRINLQPGKCYENFPEQ